ncbi:MAG: hypothetical protein N838_13985 [Thiohalocapsa sp. PB-PSB1]|nr:MAG: hypothetical protein N838_13985 [Thiohalocapsa sp. PB-PSB1]
MNQVAESGTIVVRACDVVSAAEADPLHAVEKLAKAFFKGFEHLLEIGGILLTERMKV